MDVTCTDGVTVGAGRAGLRAAIAAIEADQSLQVSLLCKVNPMRSHRVTEVVPPSAQSSANRH